MSPSEHEEKRRHVIEKGAYSLDPSLPLTPLVLYPDY